MGKVIGKVFTPSAEQKEETPQVFRCEICGKEYKTERGLADHMAEKHPLDITPDPEDGTENGSDAPV